MIADTEADARMKVGIIGCGFIAREAHLPAYQSLGIEITGVSDPIVSNARSCARKFGAKKWFKDYQDLLKEPVDLVSICTPSHTHAAIAIDAANAGKHVLVEKPMATSLEEADRMIEASEASNVRLGVVHNYRLVPCVQKAKRCVEDGRIGTILSMHVVGHDFIPTHSGWFYYKWGLLDDIGSHLIDIVNYLCGSPMVEAKVIARDYLGSMNCFTHVLAVLLLENGAAVSLDLSWITGSYEMTFKVLGTAGALNVDIRNNHLSEIHGYSTPLEELGSTLRKLLGIGRGVLDGTYFKGYLQYHQLVIRHFVDCIANGGPTPMSGAEGRAVIAMIDSIKRSSDGAVS